MYSTTINMLVKLTDHFELAVGVCAFLVGNQSRVQQTSCAVTGLPVVTPNGMSGIVNG